MIVRMLILLAALVPVPLAAQTTTKNVQDYLPLAVGNSWTYEHVFFDDRSGDFSAPPLFTEYTLSILRTEVIDGETYYVFSDISTTVPLGPPRHFLNGKKLRWDGNNLTEHDGTSTLSLFRFNISPGSDGTYSEYSIQETHGDTLVKTRGRERDRYTYQRFSFRGNPESSTAISFVADFGVYRVIEGSARGDMIVMRNTLEAIRAVFQTTTAQENGARDAGASSSVTVEWEDFQCYTNEYDIQYGSTCNYPPTSTPASSWGSVKEIGNR